MTRAFTESVVEDDTLSWLQSLGYGTLHGPDMAVGEPAAERSDPNYRDVVLEGRLRQALASINPDLSVEAIEDAALAWLESLGYAVLHGPDTAAGFCYRDIHE